MSFRRLGEKGKEDRGELVEPYLLQWDAVAYGCGAETDQTWIAGNQGFTGEW